MSKCDFCKVAQDCLEHGTVEKCIYGKKLLVVVDMQNDFCYGALANPQTTAVVGEVVNKIKNTNADCVIATLDTHFSNYMETLEGQKLPIQHCIENTEGHDIVPLVREAINHTSKGIMYKTKFTFAVDWCDFDWEECFDYVDENDDIEEIEIIGVCTDICVVSNALALRAVFPDTKIVVDSSCCAGTTIENHEAALKVMQSCQIDII